MPPPKLSRLELKIMEALWDHGPSSIREIQERFPHRSRPAYTTVQTTVGRMEAKKASSKCFASRVVTQALTLPSMANLDQTE